MAETTIKYISLDNLDLYNDLLWDKISVEDAKSLKTVALSSDGSKLLFYRVSEPVGSTTPAYEIEFPKTDLSGLIAKVVDALAGNLPVFETGGGLKDSGVKLSDLATTDYVNTKVAEEISKAGHLSKEIVTVLPDAASAKANTIYLIKIDSVTGSDKYEEWTLIGNELVKIGDTTTDLSGYYTKEHVESKISDAKQAAIDAAAADATSKANTALSEAKKYTDEEVKKVSDVASANAANITTIQGNISTINNTLQTHSDKLTALENKAIPVATDEDIRALFA